MTPDDRLTYLVGVYGFAQLALKDVGLLNERGRLAKKKKFLNASEQDAIWMYDWVGEQIKHIGEVELRKRGNIVDTKVKKLLNGHQEVNNYLLSVFLLRHYVDDGTMMEKILLGNKIDRMVDVVDSAVSDDDFNPAIKRTTARTSMNIYRQFIGRPQLSDEVLDAKYKKIRRKL